MGTQGTKSNFLPSENKLPIVGKTNVNANKLHLPVLPSVQSAESISSDSIISNDNTSALSCKSSISSKWL